MKTKTMHTPGPWVVIRNPSTGSEVKAGYFIAAPDGHYIAGVYEYPSGWPENGSLPVGNKNLIAAAPDLLAAAKLAHRAIILCENMAGLAVQAGELRAAIAQAEGQEAR